MCVILLFSVSGFLCKLENKNPRYGYTYILNAAYQNETNLLEAQKEYFSNLTSVTEEDKQ